MSEAPADRGRIQELAHELRTPLAIIIGFADTLQRRGESLSAQQRDEFAERILAAARELIRTVDTLDVDHFRVPPPED